MGRNTNRRSFLAVAGAAAAVGVSAGKAGAAEKAGKVKIIAVCCSPRKGKTTATSLKACLAAAKDVDKRIETELIELAGMSIPGQVAAGVPLAPGEKDDFPALVPTLSAAQVGGIIVGTPVYFGNMSYLCKAFLDRCMAFRKNKMALSDKVAGVLAVGGCRNGGQEITIQSVQAALLSQEMIVVGDGRPTAHFGATLVNQGDDISGDEFGLMTARNLGRHVAEVALRLG